MDPFVALAKNHVDHVRSSGDLGHSALPGAPVLPDTPPRPSVTATLARWLGAVRRRTTTRRRRRLHSARRTPASTLQCGDSGIR